MELSPILGLDLETYIGFRFILRRAAGRWPTLLGLCVCVCVCVCVYVCVSVCVCVCITFM